MNGEQLTLAWERPSASIIAFPVDREVLRIRDVARQIDRRSGRLGRSP